VNRVRASSWKEGGTFAVGRVCASPRCVESSWPAPGQEAALQEQLARASIQKGSREQRQPLLKPKQVSAYLQFTHQHSGLLHFLRSLPAHTSSKHNPEPEHLRNQGRSCHLAPSPRPQALCHHRQTGISVNFSNLTRVPLIRCLQLEASLPGQSPEPRAVHQPPEHGAETPKAGAASHLSPNHPFDIKMKESPFYFSNTNNKMLFLKKRSVFYQALNLLL
jgi:hypothetical protein